MLRDINNFYGFSVDASDGPIGEVKDCYFDDQTWLIRFFVVETGDWLKGRKVLISPQALRDLDWDGKAMLASITQAQVKASPDVDTNMPVSRQHEVEQLGYYGYPLSSGVPQLWGGGARPGIGLGSYSSAQAPLNPSMASTSGKVIAKANLVNAQAQVHRERGDDPHLRSCRTVERNHIHATDGDIGHVESLLVDDEAWSIRYLTVNTSDWWLGHHVLVAPSWISDIGWLNATVSVDVTRQAIKDAPPYDAKALPSPEQEHSLFAHHGRPEQGHLIS